MVVVNMGLGLVVASGVFFPGGVEAEPEVIERLVTVYEKGADIKELQDEVLAELAACESQSVKEPDGAIILDTNSRMSIGRYMWQRESVQLYYKSLYNREIGRAEAIAVAINPELSGNLTRDVLFQTDNGYANWKNCDKKISLAMKVNWIKKLID